MPTAAPISDWKHHLIGGETVESSGTDTIPVINPATEQRIGSVTAADEVDVDRAVTRAQQAFTESGWAQLSFQERAVHLRALADGLEQNRAEMMSTVTAENGSVQPIADWANVTGAAAVYRYFAELGDSLEKEEVRPYAPNSSETLVRKEPIGVAGLITAWNSPQGTYSMKLGPALLAGCATVLKPAPETPFDAFLFMDIVKAAGIPDGVVNVVFGGKETGQALVRHPGIDKVSFTGSTMAGRDIAGACGQLLKPSTMELGGKSAALLLDDVDLDTFLTWLGPSCIAHSGQICSLSTRVLAPRHRYDEIVDGLADALSSMRIGDPSDASTEVGPLVTARQRERVEGYIGIGKDEGARVVTGGGRPADLDQGFFVAPTVLADVDNGMRVAREEIFGPVLAVIPYDGGDAEAVRIANDSDYGLGGTVFSADRDRATDVARQVRTGSIGVNFYNQNPNAPFGGIRNSGWGREMGREGLDPYLFAKSIYREVR
jgi:aldehyde dehydrogenase (NAD+)